MSWWVYLLVALKIWGWIRWSWSVVLAPVAVELALIGFYCLWLFTFCWRAAMRRSR